MLPPASCDDTLSCVGFKTKRLSCLDVLYCSQYFFIAFILLFISSLAFGESPDSFNQAKRIAVKLFSSQRETLYCACRFDAKNQVDLNSCQMSEAYPIKRARRIEWEHMMPAQHFGQHFPCWNERLCESKGKPYRGRKCCSKLDPVFKHIESELYNLWPAVGVVNQARSNYAYALLQDKTRLYGCEFGLDKQKKQVEPRDEVKGLVARANLFISYFYNIPLKNEQRSLFEQWHAQFPPTEKEKAWARKVAEIEGYSNPYISTNQKMYLSQVP